MNVQASKVLIIIPCYNEEKRLPVEAFTSFVKENKHIHFLFVDDGSTDNTAMVLKNLASYSSHFSFLICKKNQGKAGAIREGVLSLKVNGGGC